MSGVQFVMTVPPEKKCKEPKCTKDCEPMFDRIGTACGCKDVYYGGLCDYVGITGFNGKNYCITYDQNYGGCLSCIGCKKDCGTMTACPFF